MEPESTSTPASSTRPPRLRRGRRFLAPLCFLVIVISAIGFYMLGRGSVFHEHPELASQAQANAILVKVSALIQLPSGETPTMATIEDAVAVKKEQPFLNNAANGDVLIVYPNAKTALLYRPSTNKLIAVGPVNTEPGNQIAQQVQNPESVVSSTSIKDATENTSTN